MTTQGSLSPAIWGHSGWKFLFASAYVYPKERASSELKEKYYNFFFNLQYTLPCAKCRKHFGDYIKNHPLQFALDNRDTIMKWLIGLHNLSNSDNMLFNQDQATKRYIFTDKYQRSRCQNCERELQQNIKS